MNRRRIFWLAWSSWIVVIICAVASFVIRMQNVSAGLAAVHGAQKLSEILLWLILFPAAVPAFATVGAVLAWRRAQNPIGWLCLALGFLVATQDIAWQYAQRALEIAPGSLPAGLFVAWLANILGVLAFPLPLALLVLRFPTGQPLTRRWRFAEWFAYAVVAAQSFWSTFAPTISAGLHTKVTNPIGIRALAPLATFATPLSLLSLLTLLIAVLALILRWRQSTGQERQQIKWLMYIGAVSIICALISNLAAAVFNEPAYWMVIIDAIGMAGATIGIPVAIGIAVLRYRLYEIDLIIHRTLVYTVLTSTLALIYLSSVIVLQQLFHVVAGGSSPLVTVLSTLAIAGLFTPLRGRVQKAIDRRFYRRKYDAEKILEAFSATVRDEVELDPLLQRLVMVVEETLQPEQISIWVKHPVVSQPLRLFRQIN